MQPDEKLGQIKTAYQSFLKELGDNIRCGNKHKIEKATQELINLSLELKNLLEN